MGFIFFFLHSEKGERALRSCFVSCLLRHTGRDRARLVLFVVVRQSGGQWFRDLQRAVCLVGCCPDIVET